MSAPEEMSGGMSGGLLADEWALRRLLQRYAQAADRNDPQQFVSLFLENAVIVGPGFRVEGHEQIRHIPGMLAQQYRGTLHCVLNQTVTIEGDEARGESYCMAYHRYDGEDGRPMTLDWAIRYQDRFARRGNEWRFAHRQLVVDWTRRTPVELLPAPES